jgi:predicted RNA binding protein YcfA (HicA-like mRNA interferase family)
MGKRAYPPLTPAEVIAILTALGFKKRGQTGSHAQYLRPGDAARKTALVSVDVHYKEFDAGLMHLMVQQSKFSRKEFYGATKYTARRACVPFLLPA